MSAALRLRGGESSPRIWLGLLALALILLGISAPMYLVLAMWVVVYLAREPLAGLAARLPGDAGFLVAAIVFGMLTESFAILNNLSRPPADRVLLSPEPWRDLVFGSIYYSAVAATWLLLLRRFAFSGRDLFLVTGLYGVLVEQMGLVAVHIVTWPILGALYALLVAVVYGVFPMLALLVAGGRYSPARPSPGWRARAFALAALLAQWAIVGRFVFPVVGAVVGA